MTFITAKDANKIATEAKTVSDNADASIVLKAVCATIHRKAAAGRFRLWHPWFSDIIGLDASEKCTQDVIKLVITELESVGFKVDVSNDDGDSRECTVISWETEKS